MRDATLTITAGDEPGVGEPRGKLRLVHRYVLLEEIGAGGMGQVYRAYDPDLDRRIAIKLLRPRAGSSGAAVRERLFREAQAIARLSHPNVVAVHDVGEHEGEVFIAMELVVGAPLSAWMRQERPLSEVLDAFSQAGAGLAAAHAAGLVHRDFKPSNVLVGDDGVVRVADFGLARTRGREPGGSPSGPSAPTLQTLTAAGTAIGTPAYMAPEQIRGEAVDARADQYAFCVSLFEAVAGRRPHASLDEARSATAAPALPRSSRAPAWLASALRRGLAPRPGDRFASVDELLAVLRRGRRRRRRQAAALGAVVAVGLGAGALVARDGAAAAPALCRGASEQIARVWGPEARAALRARFARAGELGARSWPATAAALDDYAAAWVAARTDACEATHLRGEQSPELLDVRMVCLDRRLGELEELTHLLADADRELVARSAEAAARLSPADECADIEALVSREPLPAEPERRAAAVATQRRLAQLKSTFDAGRYRDGLAAAAEVATAARRTGHAPTIAEALYWLGRFRVQADDREAARAALAESLHQSDAGRDDALRLRALVALIELDDGGAEHAAATDVYAAQAAQVARRLGDAAADRGRVELALAGLMEERGRLVAAIGHAERAAAAIEDSLPAGHPERIQSRLRHARVVFSLGRRRAAIDILRAGEAEARAALGADHPLVARFWSELGSAHGFVGDHELAEEYSRRAVDHAEQVFGDRHSRTARAYHNLGNAHWQMRRYADAAASYQRALAIREATGGPGSRGAASERTSLGLTYLRLGRLDEAERQARRAAEIYAAASGPEHHDTAAAWGRLGAVYAERGRCDRALPLFERAMDGLRAANPNHPRLLDQVRGAVDCLLRQKRARAALPYVEEGLAVAEHADEGPRYTAELELYAARVLLATGGAAERALELARTARARVAADPAEAELRADIDALLAAHAR